LNILANRLSHTGKKFSNRNPKDCFACKRGFERRQMMTLLIARHLSAVFATKQESDLLLGES
jgi:hypothetical protein